MKKINYILLLPAVLISIFFISAELARADAVSDIISAFTSFTRVFPNVSVPTVVEVPFDAPYLARLDFAVFDESTRTFVPYYLKRETYTNLLPVSVSSDVNPSAAYLMADEKTNTYAEFPLSAPEGRVTIEVTSKSPIVSSEFSFFLDQNVILPATVEVRATDENGAQKIVVARRPVYAEIISFPRTASANWAITFTYTQPLRITELRLKQDNAKIINSSAIRFLAQPQKNYLIYYGADRSVAVPTGEAGNLADNKDVLVLPKFLQEINRQYKSADYDGDRIPDTADNCPNTGNADQSDVNGNGVGDVCDDYDKDGLINTIDNCPNDPNRDQRDTDGDKKGDACDKEESRITERHPWIPWVGIGFAAIVVIALFALTARSKPADIQP
ncbi:MAG: thrombospondin type 3 repeat-containing protein [bacterium]|nr:thrombospondin type 3 repeat-containing protein [bacterium]